MLSSEMFRCRTKGDEDATDEDTQTQIDHKSAWDLLCRVSLPVDRAPRAPALKGSPTLKLQLGLVARFMQPPCVSKVSQNKPRLTRFFFNWLRQAQPGATATSCTVAFNRLAPLHVDRNLGESHLTAVGDFTGGHLWTSSGNNGSLLQARHKWVVFDAAVPHRTMPFDGCRAYVTFYTDRSALRMGKKVRASLRGLGVPVPSAAAMLQSTAKAKKVAPHKRRMVEADAKWEAYVATRPGLAEKVGKASGSWVCKGCGDFGRWSGSSAATKSWCSNACRQKSFKPIRQAGQRKRKCKGCGELLARNLRGAPAKRCAECAAERPHR